MAESLICDMTKGSPVKLILGFTGPMLIGNIFQQLYNMVDSIVVGKFVDKDALAAVGATSSALNLIFSLVFGLSAGISIVISQYFGAGDYDNVRKSFSTAIYVLVLASAIMGITGYFVSRPMLEFLDTNTEIIDQSEIYMKICMFGILGTAGYNGMSAILRALGDTITPLIFLIVASVLNVILDLVFVIIFQWNVAGVAAATIISQYVSAIGCLAYALSKIKLLRVPVKEMKPDRKIFGKCIHFGVPVALQNSFISISMLALQSVVNNFDDTVITAAYTVVNRMEQLVMQPFMSLGTAVATFTGQNIGAKKLDRVKKGMKSSVITVLLFSLVMMPAMYFGGKYIMMLFTKKDDFDVVKCGMEGIKISSLFYSFLGMIFITRNFLSGAGDIKVPMFMGFVEVICRVLFSKFLADTIGYRGIFLATALTWAVTGVVGTLRVISGKWKNKSVVA